MKQILIILLPFFSTLGGSYPSVEDYVEYISNYINFTLHYKLPTNNWELYQTCDCSIKGKHIKYLLKIFLNRDLHFRLWSF